jgi:class 3 adenylate cyclase/tetratricopeptide (TPR) repeat protein
VSVLVADLEGSTRLAASLDAEVLHHTVQPLLDALADEVAAHGGTVQRYAGDGVVAVFGAPVARGDDPVRAVRAARAMQQRLARLNAISDEPLRMRVGVATGDVVTAADDPELARATGDAFNLASRLQTVAPVGEVAVDRRTWRDTRHAIAFRRTGGPHRLKGFPEPLAVWIAADEARGGAHRQHPLVGRSAELEMLTAVMRSAVESRTGRSVTVVGEPGVGKSRLVHELVSAAVPAAWPEARVVTGHCLPYGRGLALWPLAEILRADLGAQLGEPGGDVADDARRTLTARWQATDDVDLVSVLLASIGLAGSGDRRDVTSAHAANRDIVARLVGRAWRTYLELLADGNPLVLRIEDLHWSDDDLLVVLDIVRTTARFPLLMVATSRPRVDPARGLPGDVVDLAPLDWAATDTLLRHLLGDAAADDVVDPLRERTGGNPFFAEQLVEMLREEGALASGTPQRGRRVHLPDHLPDNVQAAIGARLDLLSPGELSVALHAAVVGRSWWPRAVAHLVGRPVDDDVDRLVGRGMCVALPDSDIRGENEIRFAHALLRDVAYERVPRRIRGRLHHDVGRWIESRAAGREQEIAEILAHHFEQAREHEATARYALLAGERKLSLFAAEEALAWLDRAQSAIDHADDARDADDLVCRIALRTGAAHEQLGAFATAEDHYRRALHTAEQGRREGRRAEALASAAHVMWLQDAYDRARPLLTEALSAAEALGRTDLVSQVRYTTGTIGLGLGQYARAAAAQRSALATARAAGDREAEAAALHGLSEALAFSGPLSTALEHSVSCSRLVRGLGWLPMLHHNENMRGWILMWMGRLAEARETLSGAATGALDLGDPRNAAHACAGLGHVMWLEGDAAAAWDALRRAAELERRFRGPRTLLMITLHELLALADDGRWAEVRGRLATGWSASNATGGSFLRAQLYAWEGWLALRDGDDVAAAGRFGEAAECAGDVRTERWYVLLIELLARVGSSASDGLVEVGRALHDVGADSPCARALGDYALLAAAATSDVPAARDVVDRADQIEADLPTRFRRRWRREVARVA